MQPPSPKPARKRKIANQTMSPVKTPASVNTENTSRVMANAERRPMRSATVPQKNAPTAMPMRLAVPIQAA